MTHQEILEKIKSDLPNYLKHKNLPLNRNFHCLNPNHEDKTPSMGYDKNRNKVHCHGCNVDYSIIDLIGIDHGITMSDKLELFNKVYELYGIEKDDKNKFDISLFPFESINSNVKEGGSHERKQEIDTLDDSECLVELEIKDIIETMYSEGKENEEFVKYLSNRGLTDDIISEYKIGYSKLGHNDVLKNYQENHNKSFKDHLYNIILPFKNEEGTFDYFVSEISDRDQVDEYNKKYRKINGVKSPIFNERYLKQSNSPEVVFICEGIYDALSVEVAGGKAIAFVGTAHKRFLSLCKKYMPRTTFVIMLDNDNAGKSANERVAKGLESLEISHIHRSDVKDLKSQGKDANEQLQNNKQIFFGDIETIISTAKNLKMEGAYNALELLDYFTNIEDQPESVEIKTGFSELDYNLFGGLHEGLYILGAVSSLGKTTFVIQMADQIAQQGIDVIFISLEMSKYELMAKSISRITYHQNRDNRTSNKTLLAKETWRILNNRLYKVYSDQEKQAIKKAIGEYAKKAKNIYIYEGRYKGNRLTVKHVKEIVKEHIARTNRTPIVFVDYLQILAPAKERQTDKQNTDDAVFELKELSRQYRTPVVAISSFNRENYSHSVSMQSFKESGAIEYSSDVLIALQYKGMGESNFKLDDARKTEPREIELKVLKQRNGKAPVSINYYLHAKYNYYEEIGHPFNLSKETFERIFAKS